MKKKLIAFDLDGTLAPSKSPLPDKIEKLLTALLEKYQVCVISGGKYQLFQTQLLANLHADPKLLANLHLMPTSGTRYYRYRDNTWEQIYAEDLMPAQKKKIINALNEGLDELQWRPKKTWGEIVEDRDSQITLVNKLPKVWCLPSKNSNQTIIAMFKSKNPSPNSPQKTSKPALGNL